MLNVTEAFSNVVGFHLIACDEDSPWSQKGKQEQLTYAVALATLRAANNDGLLNLPKLTAELANELNGGGIGDRGYFYKAADADRIAREVVAAIA